MSNTVQIAAKNYNKVKGNDQKRPPVVFYKKNVHKNFGIFTGKHLHWSLFLIKLQAIKKRLQHRCFPVNIAKCLGAPILKNICERN